MKSPAILSPARHRRSSATHPASGTIGLAVAILTLLPMADPLRAGQSSDDPYSTSPMAALDEGIIDAPWDVWTIDAESSLLWRVTDSTPLNYSLFAAAVSLRTPSQIALSCGGGTLVLRSNFTLLAEGFIDGPESYYLGWSASPSIEYWLPGRHTHLYFSAGGGFGWVDSTDVEGGQGQDFTLNWFIKSGLRHALNDRLSLSLGVFFQHLSNGGQSDRNPGLDALGPSIGLSWRL